MSSCSCATGTTGCCCSGSRPSGVSGVLVNLLTLVVVKKLGPSFDQAIVGLPGTEFNVRWYHVYSTIAFLVANLWNFQLNRTWTFRTSKHARWWSEYWPFLVVGLLGQVDRPRAPDAPHAPRLTDPPARRRSSTTRRASAPGSTGRSSSSSSSSPRSPSCSTSCGPSRPCAPTTRTSPTPATSRRCWPTRGTRPPARATRTGAPERSRGATTRSAEADYAWAS